MKYEVHVIENNTPYAWLQFRDRKMIQYNGWNSTRTLMVAVFVMKQTEFGIMESLNPVAGWRLKALKLVF